METKLASKVSWKHIVTSIILLVVFVLLIGVQTNAEATTSEDSFNNETIVVPCELSRKC